MIVWGYLCDMQAIDFLDKLLRYDHQDRLTAKEAMVLLDSQLIAMCLFVFLYLASSYALVYVAYASSCPLSLNNILVFRFPIKSLFSTHFHFLSFVAFRLRAFSSYCCYTGLLHIQ